jgi:hypothetical protein
MAMAVAGILFLSTPDAAMAGGCFVGLWCLRSHFRTAFFAAGRRNAAIVGDMIFAGVGAALCLVMFLQGASSLAHAFWILASANLLGIATMHLNARRVPILLFDRGFRACYRHLGARLAWSFASVATTNLQGQGIVLLVAGLVGPAAYAPIAAVLVFFVPLRIFGAALLNMIQPRFSADCARGDFQRVFNAAQSWSLTLGAMTFVYSACLLAVAPYLRTQALAGAPVELLCFLAALGNVGAALYNVPRAALEVLMRFRAIALVTAAGAICGGAAISLILWEVSTSWALGGAAIGEAVVLFGFWGSLLREARARGAISGFSGTHAIRLARSQTFAMFNKIN